MAEDYNPEKVPTEFQDNTDSVSEASDVAAERTRRSVHSPREPGATTMALFATGAAPLIMGHIVHGLVKKIQER